METPPNAWLYDKAFSEMLDALKMVREKLNDWNKSGPTLTQIDAAIKRASIVKRNSAKPAGLRSVPAMEAAE